MSNVFCLLELALLICTKDKMRFLSSALTHGGSALEAESSRFLVAPLMISSTCCVLVIEQSSRLLLLGGQETHP